MRTDGAGASHEFLDYLHRRRLSYSLGFGLTEAFAEAVDLIPEQAWTPAYDSDGALRDGAWVAEATGVLDLSGWPPGMRVIIRKERPHTGAQLRFTDRNGLRLIAFVTNTTRGQLPDLELRHRRRARCEVRIRTAKDTGLANLPLHGFAQNQLWCAIVQLACELTAWMQMLTLGDHPARRWEPKRLRLRLFSIAARISRHARHTRLRLSTHNPWAGLLATTLTRLQPGIAGDASPWRFPLPVCSVHGPLGATGDTLEGRCQIHREQGHVLALFIDEADQYGTRPGLGNCLV